MWRSFVFAAPWALWLLAGLPVLALLRSRAGAGAAVRFSSLAPFRSAGMVKRARSGGLLVTLLLGALGCCILALARPQTSERLTQSEASGIDIMLALDVSGSMMAEDITIGTEQANRIEAVKKLTGDFIEGRPNDRIGMIAFAGRPYLVSPLTLDHDWLLKNLERVRIGLVEDGTAIGSAIASCANRLKDRKDSKSRIIVLLTDGGNNAGKISPPTAAEAAHALGIKIYTIGVGSTGTARIQVKDQFGRMVYRQIECEVDEPGLKKLADIGQGEFYRATDARSLKRIFTTIDQLEKSTVEISERKRVRELFPWCVAAGALLAALSAVLGQTIWRALP